MKERTIKEIEDEMAIRSEQGEIGRVMDLVDEHGNTFDKMHQAIEEGDLKRVIEIEKLGVNSAEERFVKVAVMYDRNLIVYHQSNKVPHYMTWWSLPEPSIELPY